MDGAPIVIYMTGWDLQRMDYSMTKSIAEHFIDWEAHVFGYGYGTGEPHTLAALKEFFDAFGVEDRPNSYDYEDIEEAVGVSSGWLLINILCHADVIEYGTSPRFGWLTSEGEKLKAFVDIHSVDEMMDLCCGHGSDYIHCYPNACNCGPDGYQKGRKCDNPFWK